MNSQQLYEMLTRKSNLILDTKGSEGCEDGWHCFHYDGCGLVIGEFDGYYGYSESVVLDLNELRILNNKLASMGIDIK